MAFDNAKLNSSTIASHHSSNDRVCQKNVFSSIGIVFSQIGLFLQKALHRIDEPQISQARTRSGSITWHVYDPMSRCSVVLNSETEVRVWLEQRFHSAF